MKEQGRNKGNPTNLNFVGNSLPQKHRENQLILVHMGGYEEDERKKIKLSGPLSFPEGLAFQF